ncbi:tryptophan 7-halogenase [Acinetobacter sp. ACIN00229]|nr:tryptophan 7-halogenase [Acinetobacter sp. ACIN00229]MBI0424985.1 tryptophan 7-halogenase [Acinetobacter sp. ACIN00229]
MLNLRNIKTISIIGGGTAGWFAALTMRRLFPSSVDIQVIESPNIGVLGVGEGGLLNLIQTLNKLGIPTSEFMRETGASLKWGFCYEGGRTGQRDDEFYHLFINPELSPFNYEYRGFYPIISSLISQNIPLANVVKGFNAIVNQVSQKEAIDHLVATSGVFTSLHFDSDKVASFLCQKTTERGVKHLQMKVQDIFLMNTDLRNKLKRKKAY